MGWLIAVLGTGLAVGGTIAIYFGAPYIQVEWGYSEVIAGTTALSAGIVTVALAAIFFALRDLKSVAVAGGPDPAARESGRAAPAAIRRTGSEPAVAVPPPSAGGPNGPEAARPDDEPALFPPAREPEASREVAPTVVGRYEANGASYVLFSDGTIEVENETGTHRYASMQDLRAHIERQETGSDA